MGKWSFGVCVAAAGVLLGAKSASAQQVTSSVAPVTAAADSKPKGPLAGWRWYGWQPLLLDMGAGALFAFGESQTSSKKNRSFVDAREPYSVLGATTFVVGAPVAHFANRRFGAGALSFGLRIALPLAGVAGAQEAGGTEDMKRAALIMTMVSASLLDAAVLSWKPPVAKKSLSLAPTAAWDGERGGSVGVAGVF